MKLEQAMEAWAHAKALGLDVSVEHVAAGEANLYVRRADGNVQPLEEWTAEMSHAFLAPFVEYMAEHMAKVGEAITAFAASLAPVMGEASRVVQRSLGPVGEGLEE